jgi:hypothetical protein
MEYRKTEMEKERTELEAWAESNGIDMQYLIGFGMGRQRRGDGFKSSRDLPPDVPTPPASE